MASPTSISQQIWDMKYRLKGADGQPVDRTMSETWDRVAAALAAPEAEPASWGERFREALEDFKFLPAGRILAGAGAQRNVTLFNCFVMGTVPDDMAGIFEGLKEAALTMQQGGGIGYDFSTLRPKGAPVRGVGADASGPLTFMDVWDSMCRTVMSAGHRRGAMMATMRCDHPDIEAFVEAKQTAGRLRMFNLSVLVSDAFMAALDQDGGWDLVFDGVSHGTVRARDLWDRIMRATYAAAEPGVIFIDRVNRRNPLAYCETIAATNPCGEQPLPPYGACLLGSINLARLVLEPFTANARLNLEAVEALVPTAVRMMDNVVEVSRFPLPAQAHEARAKRRIGLGVTGLADALIMCRARYGDARAVALTESWLAAIQRGAYLASARLAEEKGVFPLFDREAYLAVPAIQAQDAEVRDAIAAHGLRNALLTSIAPTGTISLFADNVSSGIEPVFSLTHNRSVLQPDGSRREEEISGYAYRLYRRIEGEDAPLPEYFVDSQAIGPRDHLAMQAAAQRHVDSAISKTVNVPADTGFEAFREIYAEAYAMGCKGCTTYRPNEITGAVLSAASEDAGHQAELPLEMPKAPAPADDGYDAGGVVYMTQPLNRPEELAGRTYKLRWPDSDHAIYVTLNDIVQDGRRRPFEVFINSKNMEHFAWTVALTRMISAVFRRGGDVSFVVDELKAVFDPRGGQWMEGRYVPSLLAALGEVIERHMIDIGFLSADEPAAVPPVEARRAAAGALRQCPKCGQAGLIRQEGCDICTSCAYSRCG